MNALQAPPEEFAQFVTRERVEGKIEIACPTCGEWRPGYCVVKQGDDWLCDADVSTAVRVADAEARADDLDALETELHTHIDHCAGNFRRRFITEIAGQQLTYDRKEREAREFLAAVEPDPADFVFLNAEATETEQDIADVAAAVVANADAWALLGAAIEGRRLGAKRAVTLAKAGEGTVAERRDAMNAAAAVDWEALAP
jgi:hypothetical protein